MGIRALTNIEGQHMALCRRYIRNEALSRRCTL